jgi:DNA gyrase subunit B
LLTQYRAVLSLVNKVSQRGYSRELLLCLVESAPLHVEMLSDKTRLQTWCENVEAQLIKYQSELTLHRVLLREDPTTQHFYPVVQVTEHTMTREMALTRAFITSGEYRTIAKMAEILHSLLEKDAFVQKSEKIFAVNRFVDVYQWLIEEAKRGQTIQRYKGLGEMNPEQLWETTMNADVRRLLKVTIEDAVAADMLFTTLMGDDVEPRRAFIEKNALLASNIDI